MSRLAHRPYTVADIRVIGYGTYLGDSGKRKVRQTRGIAGAIWIASYTVHQPDPTRIGLGQRQ